MAGAEAESSQRSPQHVSALVARRLGPSHPALSLISNNWAARLRGPRDRDFRKGVRMKINGRSANGAAAQQISLPRAGSEPLLLTLRPLPLGFHRRLRERGIVSPLPPTRVARDSAGKPIRDSQGLAVLVADESDADYREQRERYHQRVAVLMVAEALQADATIEFDRRPSESETDWHHYADDLYREFEQAGFSAGDLIYLCEEVCRLSNLLDDHLRAAQQNFSPVRSGAIP